MESSGPLLSMGQIAGLNWLSPEVGGMSQPSIFSQVPLVIHVHRTGWTVASYIGLSFIPITFSTSSQNRNGDLYTSTVRYQESSDQQSRRGREQSRWEIMMRRDHAVL